MVLIWAWRSGFEVEVGFGSFHYPECVVRCHFLGDHETKLDVVYVRTTILGLAKAVISPLF
jgi:hypothetical protein